MQGRWFQGDGEDGLVKRGHALIAEEIRTVQLPSRLYKYRKFDNYTDSMFANHHLYFSKPSAFNDPFDCQIYDNYNYSRDEVYIIF